MLLRKNWSRRVEGVEVVLLLAVFVAVLREAARGR